MWLGKVFYLRNTFYKSQRQSQQIPLSSVKEICQVTLRDNVLVCGVLAVLLLLLGHDSYTRVNVLKV